MVVNGVSVISNGVLWGLLRRVTNHLVCAAIPRRCQSRLQVYHNVSLVRRASPSPTSAAERVRLDRDF